MGVFKKRNTWWIDYYYMGKRYREKISTRKREAEDALNQIKVQIATGTFVTVQQRRALEVNKPKPITFSEFTDTQFKDWSREHHSEKSHIRLLSMIDRHLKPVFGPMGLEEITRKHIEDYLIRRRRSRYKRGTKTFPTSEATINRELTAMKGVMRKAVEWELLEVSPAHGIREFKEKNAVPVLLEREEVMRLLDEAPPHFHALVACAVYAGLRREELFHLRWQDIHWKRGELVVASTREHIIVGSPYVFSNRRGRPYTDIREPLDAAAQRAGIGDTVKLHQLRHAFCSHALMLGVDPRTVQKWMGHKDLKTTLRYAHVSPDHEKAAIERLSYRVSEKTALFGISNS